MVTRKDVKSIARRLRRQQTEAERIFWLRVRDRKFEGVKFQRQFPIVFDVSGKKKFFVADFYCHQFKLAIEIDGSVHDDKEQIDRDEFRTERLEEIGINVVRFTNKIILVDMNKVLNEIKKIFDSSPLFPREGLGVS